MKASKWRVQLFENLPCPLCTYKNQLSRKTRDAAMHSRVALDITGRENNQMVMSNARTYSMVFLVISKRRQFYHRNSFDLNDMHNILTGNRWCNQVSIQRRLSPTHGKVSIALIRLDTSFVCYPPLMESIITLRREYREKHDNWQEMSGFLLPCCCRDCACFCLRPGEGKSKYVLRGWIKITLPKTSRDVGIRPEMSNRDERVS